MINLHGMEEISSAVLPPKRLRDELRQRAEMGAALATYINIVSLEKLHEYLWHYNDY